MKMSSEEENLENLSPEELERRMQKDYYSKSILEKLREKLKGEVQEEKIESPDILFFYADQAMNKKLEVNPNTGKTNFGTFEDGYLHIFIYNNSEDASITDIQFSFSEKELKVVECPQELSPKELKPLTLRFLASRAFKSDMRFSYSVIYKGEE
jgi:hypothetical protein